MLVGDRKNEWKDWDENSRRKDGQVRNKKEKGDRQVITRGISANSSETQSVAGREGQGLSGIRRRKNQQISRMDGKLVQAEVSV